ncbi:MAG: hypothetical protein ACRDQD_29690, partial [Nocardioidaceae bacterium]
DWAWITIAAPTDQAAGQHSLLIRRRISDGELAFYRCWSREPVPLHVLVRVAGTRWQVETCFQTGKTTGLDEPQVRRWDSWYRHTTLVMLAHAILTVIAAREHTRPIGDHSLEPPWIFRRENQLRSFLFGEERGNGDGEAAQVVYCGI